MLSKKYIGLFIFLLLVVVFGYYRTSSPSSEIAWGKELYQKNCASCHHKDRIGQIGPPLLPEFIHTRKDSFLISTIQKGLPATQMQGFPQLSSPEIKAILRYLKTPGSFEWNLGEVEKNKVESLLPAASYTIESLSQLTAVVERGKQEVWLMEGTTLLDQFAFPNIHGGIKFCPKGTAFYVPSRDGWIGRYDLLEKKFSGKIRTCIYLRNIALSQDGKYIFAASWLPKGITVVEARTLKPVSMIPVPGKISAIYEMISQNKAVFTFRDKPQVGLLDGEKLSIAYFNISEPMEDFFLDPQDRFMVGSFRQGKLIRVLDLEKRKVVFEHESPGMPHLFSAAFWYEKGHFYFATPHMSKPWISLWRMYDWSFVKKIDIGGDGFFVRTHPNTPYLWADNGKDELVLIDKKDYGAKKIIPVPGKKVLHTEFSSDGQIAYISIFDKNGFLAFYDGCTLQERGRMDANEPVGKYNFRNKQRPFQLPDLGKEVFMGKCWGCHHTTERAFAPAFKWIINHREESWIRAQILNPKTISAHLGYPLNAMPKIPISNDEIEAILAFMRELKR